MRICLELIGMLTLSLTCSTAWATSRLGEATVELRNGLPCFSLSAKDMDRDRSATLQAIAVSDVSVQPSSRAWWIIFQPSLPVTEMAGACYPYGESRAGAEDTGATPLRSGVVYSVFLNVRPSDRSDPTHGYTVKFCMAGESEARKLVPMSAWRGGACQ
ncbi:hypothetical protein [Roseateles amylovorans]|uniref:Uncharacterized protein n=1 Tax=Roseateles amylovorans TaxID=2978473 RepID=A0ABY6B1G4_9BURK|nr:hypothetical protein [Roseateles amylovorans]UXH77165.1 hypothetical protein N4261_19415 [Roseateles amylovorans]